MCGMSGALMKATATVAQQPGTGVPPGVRQAWTSQPPKYCQLELSTTLTGILCTGRHSDHRHSDTWHPRHKDPATVSLAVS